MTELPSADVPRCVVAKASLPNTAVPVVPLLPKFVFDLLAREKNRTSSGEFLFMGDKVSASPVYGF